MSSDGKVPFIQGQLEGIVSAMENGFKEIKSDIRSVNQELKKNHEDLLERQSSSEARIESLYDWREHHIQDNEDSKKQLDRLEDKTYREFKEINKKIDKIEKTAKDDTDKARNEVKKELSETNTTINNNQKTSMKWIYGILTAVISTMAMLIVELIKLMGG